jgi:predicted nucleic acid-binding protein
MGLILDSSVVIAAERERKSARQFVRSVIDFAPHQELALSAVGLTELVHGIYRSDSPERQAKRKLFINELCAGLKVYPYVAETAFLAGRIHGEQMAKGIVIPYADLLIGATALSLGYSVLTTNVRHFQLIPGLKVISV